MKLTEKINNSRSNIRNKIFSSLIPKDVKIIIAVVIGIIVLVLITVLATAAANANSSGSIGLAIEGADCLLDSSKEKTCVKDLTCFIPLTRNNTIGEVSGTCVRTPKFVSVGAYCTNSSSGPNCETGSVCLYVPGDSYSSAAKCLKI